MSTTTAAAPSQQPDIGPQPSWDEAVQLGNQAILSRLIDPDSARVSWPYVFVDGTLKALFGHTRAGWYTCGTVNAKNRMGGYTGAVPFLILIHDGKVQSLDIGEADGVDTATVTCNDLAKRGILQPSNAPSQSAPASQSAALSLQSIQAAASANANTAAKQGGIGISFLAAPAGLVVMAVAPESPAAVAGVKVGEVIQSVNGVDLKGMPEPAAVAVLHGLPKEFIFNIVGVGDVKITRP
jgi:hypothetical protein